MPIEGGRDGRPFQDTKGFLPIFDEDRWYVPAIGGHDILIGVACRHPPGGSKYFRNRALSRTGGSDQDRSWHGHLSEVLGNRLEVGLKVPSDLGERVTPDLLQQGLG